MNPERTGESDFPSEESLTEVTPGEFSLASTPPSQTLAASPPQRLEDPFLTRRVMVALTVCAFSVGVGIGSMLTMRGVDPRGLTTQSPPTPISRTVRESPSAGAALFAGNNEPSPPIDAAGPESAISKNLALSTRSAPQQPGPGGVASPVKRAGGFQTLPVAVPGVANRRTTTSKAVFRGMLVLNSLPSGAAVSIDGARVGATPLVVTRIAAGSRVVRVTSDGHQPWSSAVRVVANQRNVVNAVLRPTP